MTNRPALKPCPLCGGEPYFNGHGVECYQCGLWLGAGTQMEKVVPRGKGSMADQVHAVWNMRARGGQ